MSFWTARGTTLCARDARTVPAAMMPRTFSARKTAPEGPYGPHVSSNSPSDTHHLLPARYHLIEMYGVRKSRNTASLSNTMPP